MDLERLRAEAARQGLTLLTDEDLLAIGRMVEESRRALAAARPAEAEGVEPPLWLVPPGSPPGSISR